jgi:hypothetical protein
MSAAEVFAPSPTSLFAGNKGGLFRCGRIGGVTTTVPWVEELDAELGFNFEVSEGVETSTASTVFNRLRGFLGTGPIWSKSSSCMGAAMKRPDAMMGLLGELESGLGRTEQVSTRRRTRLLGPSTLLLFITAVSSEIALAGSTGLSPLFGCERGRALAGGWGLNVLFFRTRAQTALAGSGVLNHLLGCERGKALAGGWVFNVLFF